MFKSGIEKTWCVLNTLGILVLWQFPVLSQGQPPLPPMGMPPISDLNRYRLGVGDRIRIDILDNPDYSGEYLIAPDGRIHLPWIQPISVLNLTPQELETEITRQYTPILKRPSVTITLTQVRPIAVNISGEVNRPGVYPVGLDTGQGSQPRFRYPTIPELLQVAGGITLAANLRQIQIHRPLPGNQKQIIPINLLQLLQTGGNIDSLVLQDGDSVFVPSSDQIKLAEIPQLATLSFSTPADTSRNITILGEVVTPGEYVIIGGDSRSELRPGGLPTVSWAIRTAGGITQNADLRRIQIHRPTRSRQLQVITLNLWDFIQGKDFSQNTIIQDGDTLVIPPVDEINLEEAIALGQTSLSPESIRVFVVGEKPPNLTGGAREITVPLNTPMNQALLAADGYVQRRIRQTSVDLVRVNRDGTAFKRQIFVDLSAKVNSETNPPLQNGDIIILSRSGLARFIDFVSTVDQVLRIAEPTREILNILEILGYLRTR